MLPQLHPAEAAAAEQCHRTRFFSTANQSVLWFFYVFLQFVFDDERGLLYP
jgi:hypothetical protein